MSEAILLGVGLALAAGGVHMLPLVGTGLLVMVALLSLGRPAERNKLLIVVLLVNFGYWVSSALLTGLPLSRIFSYGFLRWHLRSIFGYLPLLAIAVSGYRFTERAKKVAVCALLIPATLICLVGAAQYATGFRIGSYSERALPSTVRYDLGEYWFFGFLRAHVTCGGYYATVALVALGLFWFWRTDWWRRGLIFLALGASAWGLMFSKARTFIGAFAGAACLMFVYGCWVRLRRKGTDRHLPLRPHLVGMALGAVVAAYCLTPGLHGRMRATFGEPDADLPSWIAAATKHDRPVFWGAAFRLFKRHPVFGAGLSRFGDEYRSYAQQLRIPLPPATIEHHAHNSWLHVAAELGLVGVGLLCTIWVV
ncbi:MAG: O-antigen ligase family protein, partial [Planctomycetes bacterium]|nr:O-antigen ligase family protein [Planctomycetota bacterium]